ncbi:MAG TPA: Sua5/YciO/YrdC/YwlC family protein [Patescibacteria group bacterium]|nr:Sua5/YciO/YrdC/YwlC family protein [Patescibacteria group bacterium]
MSDSRTVESLATPLKIEQGKALRLQANRHGDLVIAANIIKNGGVGIAPFKGPFGFFGDYDNKEANARVMYDIKHRAPGKILSAIIRPDNLHSHVDFSKTSYTQEDIKHFQTKLHALGVRLPAKSEVPEHMTVDGTIMSIWSEYDPINIIMTQFQNLGGRALFGTSANESHEPTIIKVEDAWNKFGDKVDFILEEDLSYLPEERRMSTTLVDFTKDVPIQMRAGNVSVQEINSVLRQRNKPDLLIP